MPGDEDLALQIKEQGVETDRHLKWHRQFALKPEAKVW